MNKSFYNFEKIDERGQKKFKEIIAHNSQIDELHALKINKLRYI